MNNTGGLDKQKTIEGMKQEILSMKQQQVYIEVDINTLTPEQRKNIVQSRWVLRDKGNKVLARIRLTQETFQQNFYMRQQQQRTSTYIRQRSSTTRRTTSFGNC